MDKIVNYIGRATAVLALVISAGCETYSSGTSYPSRSTYVPGHGWVDRERENEAEIRAQTQMRMDRENNFQRERAEDYRRAMENRDRNEREVQRMHREWQRGQRR